MLASGQSPEDQIESGLVSRLLRNPQQASGIQAERPKR